MRVAKQPSNWRWLKRATCYSSRIGSRAGASFEPTARAASRRRAPSGLQVTRASWLAIGRSAGFAIFPEAEGYSGSNVGQRAIQRHWENGPSRTRRSIGSQSGSRWTWKSARNCWRAFALSGRSPFADNQVQSIAPWMSRTRKRLR